MSTQSLSVSAIQSRAQPNYAGIEPGRKVLTRESPITIFAKLTDKLAETSGVLWLFVKQAPQTFPYLSANGLIVLCVNVQFTHVCTPMQGLPELFLQFGNWRLTSVPRSILSAISLDCVRQKNDAGANQRDDGPY
jgi:hypothetical protein